MTLAIVAYPRLEDSDRRWIGAFRSKHDPQASRLGAHFTLVFPFEGAASDLAQEVAGIAASTPPIAFAIRRTEVAADALVQARCHVFLVPH